MIQCMLLSRAESPPPSSRPEEKPSSAEPMETDKPEPEPEVDPAVKQVMSLQFTEP